MGCFYTGGKALGLKLKRKLLAPNLKIACHLNSNLRTAMIFAAIKAQICVYTVAKFQINTMNRFGDINYLNC
jgi:hypothetical protein